MNSCIFLGDNMNKTIFAAMVFVLLPSVAAQLQISEVYYDAIDESGSEFVELYNPSGNDIDISGWRIATETSLQDAIIPDGAVIQSQSHYLIADLGFSESKDNAIWGDADHEEAITLASDNAGVALFNGDTLIDAVGWGDAAEIDSGLYEGTPFSDVAEGHSIERINDSDNNINDFVDRENPNPESGRGISANKSTLTMLLNVVDYGLKVVYINLTDDDMTQEGNQVMPEPGKNKSVNVVVMVEYGGGADAISDLSLELGENEFNVSSENSSSLTKIFFAQFEMEYHTSPGNYTVSVSANAGEQLANGSITFEYMRLNAITLDSDTINFSTALPGGVIDVIGDRDFGTEDKLTIRNFGNVELDIGIMGSRLMSGENEISQIQYTLDGEDFNSGLAGILGETFAINDLNLAVLGLNELSFRVNVPEQAKQGLYTGSTTIIAVGSD